MAKQPLNEGTRTGLRQLADTRPEFAVFFRTLGSVTTKNSSVTELDKFLSNQQLASLNDARGRAAAIEFFRQLETLGAGQFRIGRRGKPTRFMWDLPSNDVAVAGVGQSPQFPERTDTSKGVEPKVSSPAAMHLYVLRLREGLAARMELPVDLTVAEAKRITAFIETLPLENQR